MFYGVGIGPGDPELVTVKAVRILGEVDVIAVPDTGGEKTALSIAEPYITNQEILTIETPMTRDPEKKEEYRGKAKQRIERLLDTGRNVALITLGDPTVYSTCMYIHDSLRRDGYATMVVPGVTSFTAAAAALKQPLCEGAEPVTIIPASYPGMEALLDHKGTRVLMKTGRSMKRVRELLKTRGLLEKTAMVERCSMPSEAIYESLADAPEDAGYFSVLIIKDSSK